MTSKLKSLFQPKRSTSQVPPEVSTTSPTDVESSELSDRLSQTATASASTTTNLPAPPAPIGKGQNYGIRELYEGGPEASIDIVFMHGLTGNAYDTWLHRDTGIHWPSELLRQDIVDGRILSFGYDADIVSFWNPASSSRLSNHAENLVGELVRHRERTNTESRKMLFVAHSLGGLVLEYALGHSRNAAEQHLRQIERYTAGIVFLGVPHCGSDLASWGKVGAQMVKLLRRSNTEIIGVLEPGSEMLRETQKSFHNILRLREDERSKISVTCFYEELACAPFGQIVPLHSAELKGYACYGIHANHMDMTKFSNREDRGYNAVLGELWRWKRSAQSISLKGPQPLALDRNTDGTNPLVKPSPNSSPSTGSKAGNLWLVPRSTNPFYTGREELAGRLAQHFSSDPSMPPKKQRTFAIFGLGGTGKSEACLKFAEDHRDEYWGVFWLDARTIATIEQGYIAIGRLCGVSEPSSESVKLWLACSSERWLLIFDNADNTDDRNIDYAIYIPHSKKGDILITTRDPECGAFEAGQSHSLECLKPELAQELLLRAAHIAEHRWKEKGEAALAIVEILGSHTLAILQAGAYIRRKLCTLEEYPATFQERKQELLRFQTKQGMSTYGNVYSTFEVSAKYLQKSNLPEHLDALEFLHTLAFMYNSGISETIFQRASDYGSKLRDTGSSNDKIFPLSAGHIARLPNFFQQEQPSSQNRSRWREARATLESLSIIAVDEDDYSITMHSLVHTWAKERQDDQDQCRGWQSAATILALSCQGWYEYCSFFIVLQPHVRACVSHELGKYMQSLSEIDTAQVLFQFVYVFYRMKDWSSLSSLLQFIRLRLQHRDRVDENIALQIKIFTGREFLERGNFPEAVEFYKEVLYSPTQVLTEDQPSRLLFEKELAYAYKRNGQIKEATELLEKIIIKVQKLAEDDSSRLTIEHALASLYSSNGQIEEAIELLKHIVRVDKRLAEDHPDRLTSQLELAVAYRRNEQIDEAVELLKHVVKISEKSFSEDHSIRLSSQHELALTYCRGKNFDKAIKLLEHVVKFDEKKLPQGHPDRLTSEYSLAAAYQMNGQIDDAVRLFEHVARIEEKKYDEHHPNRLSSQHELALTYYQGKNFDKAIKLLEHVVKFDEKKLPQGHPDRLTSEYSLAAAYQMNGQIDDAVRLFEHVARIEEKKYDEHHPNRLSSQHELALTYYQGKNFDKAIKLLEHVVKFDEKALPQGHPDRLTSEYQLAAAYRKNGPIDDAVRLFEHVARIEEKKYDEDHPHRLASQRALAKAREASQRQRL